MARIINDVHRAALAVEEDDPKDTAAGISPNRFRRCLRKPGTAVYPPVPAEPYLSPIHRSATPLRAPDSVLATDSDGPDLRDTHIEDMQPESLQPVRNDA
jgi:hypothetical protein